MAVKTDWKDIIMLTLNKKSLAVLGLTASLVSHTALAAKKKTDISTTPYGIERFVAPGVTVTSTPMFNGREGAYNSDILYSLPSINGDLILLRQRQAFYEALAKKGLTAPDHAIIAISGALEAAAMHANTYSRDTTRKEGSVNLNTAELDVSVLANPWATALFSLDYDSSPASTGSREENSRLYLQRGFITIGNLSKSPFYFTAGQMYAPFGLYHSMMITTPVTKSMGRVLKRMMVAGYDNGMASVSVYGYHSELSGSNTSPFNQGGINMLLKKTFKQVNASFGIGVISSIADSQGMLRNGLEATATNDSDQFTGLVAMEHNRKLAHGVPALALDAMTQWHHWGFTAGYVSALRSFDSADMSFNSHGAQPAALHTELNYVWHWHARPITVGLTYGHTWEALALNLPQNSIGAVANMSPWKGVTVGLEYRHGLNYIAGNQASGGMIVSSEEVYDIEAGGHQDSITAQVGFYF